MWLTRTVLVLLGTAGLWWTGAGCGAPRSGPAAETASPRTGAVLVSLALRVHDMERMEAFYGGAFGFRFRDEATGGFVSRFGEADGVTLKLVPIRDAPDFVGFPVHQPGFVVTDVEATVALAERLGGRREGDPVVEGGVVVGVSVRDPDGNTLEVYRR